MARRKGNGLNADWEQLPDDGNRYQIIAGVLYMTSAPSYFHQQSTTKILSSRPTRAPTFGNI
jgi:hypothetical protein